MWSNEHTVRMVSSFVFDHIHRIVLVAVAGAALA